MIEEKTKNIVLILILGIISSCFYNFSATANSDISSGSTAYFGITAKQEDGKVL